MLCDWWQLKIPLSFFGGGGEWWWFVRLEDHALMLGWRKGKMSKPELGTQREKEQEKKVKK
jgi:hypothetical protein